MDFAQPFRLFFRHPKAWMNLLLLGVCALIPLIGYLVITGYMAQCLAEWERDPEKQEFSEFDFGRFVPYLTAGLWPFLAVLVISLPVILLGFAACMAIFIAAVSAGGGGEPDGVFLVLLFGAMFLFMVGLQILISLISLPIATRAAFMQDFAPAFSWSYARSFFAKTWKQAILVVLFCFAFSIAAMIVGYMALIIGVYFAMGLVFFVSWHLDWQLYRLHLSRGGEPIPISPTLYPPAPLPPPPMPNFPGPPPATATNAIPEPPPLPLPPSPSQTDPPSRNAP